jgi:hypothetical protein
MGGAPGNGTCAAPYDYRALATETAGRFRLEGTTNATELSGSCGGVGDEAVYRFEAPSAGTWAFSTADAATRFDTVLYVNRTCDAGAEELACTDDDLEGTTSSVAVALAAGEVVFVVVDAFDTGGAFGLTARTIFAPELTSAEALVSGDDLRLRLVGRDADADVASFDLQLLDAAGQIIELADTEDNRITELSFSQSVLGQAEFEATALVAGLSAFPQTASVRLWLRDALGLVSAPRDVPLGDIPVVQAGMACDPDGFRNRCAEGLVCSRPAMGDGVCRAPAPPQIVSGTLFREDDLGFLRVTCADPDQDAETVSFAFLDANGGVVPFEGQDTQTLDLDRDFARRPEFSIRLFLEFGVFGDVMPAPVAVRVFFTDGAGLQSMPVVFDDLGPRPTVQVGDACDPIAFDNVCAASMCEGEGEVGVCR